MTDLYLENYSKPNKKSNREDVTSINNFLLLRLIILSNWGLSYHNLGYFSYGRTSHHWVALYMT